MREKVIVYVKSEIRSDDEDDAHTSPKVLSSDAENAMAECSKRQSANPRDSVDGAEAESSSPASSSSATHSWPCASCGRLFARREEVLAHYSTEHAEELLQDYIKRSGEEAIRKIAAMRSAQASLAQPQVRMFPGPQLQLPPGFNPGLMRPPFLLPAQFMLQQPRLPFILPPGFQANPASLLGARLPIPVQQMQPRLQPQQHFRLPTALSQAEQQSQREFESRRGRPRHPVWRLFSRLDKFDAECTLCKSRVRSACPTNLCRHLNNNHCVLAKQLFVKWKEEKESAGGSYPPLDPSNRSPPAQKTVRAATVVPPKPQVRPPPPAAAAPIMGPSALLNILQQQQRLLAEQLAKSGMTPRMTQQLLVNANMIAAVASSAQRPAAVPAPTATDVQESKPEASSCGVIRFVPTSRKRPTQEENGTTSSKPPTAPSPSKTPISEVNVDRLSSAPDDCRPASAPADFHQEDQEDSKFSSTEDQPGPKRPKSLPPMLCSMDAASTQGFQFDTGIGIYVQSSFDANQQAQAQIPQPTALRQPYESWFQAASLPYDGLAAATVEATTAMNVPGAYGSLLPQDVLGLTTMDSSTTAALATLDFLGLPTAQQQQETAATEETALFASSSEDQDQTIKQEVMEDDKQQPTCSTSAPPAKRGRPTENPCWNYFVRLDDQLVRCRICQKIVKSACSTNMTKHLERHHADNHHQLLEQIRSYRQNKPTNLIVTPDQQSQSAQTPTSQPQTQQQPQISAEQQPQQQPTEQQTPQPSADSVMAAPMNPLGHAVPMQTHHHHHHHLLQPMSADGHQLLGHQLAAHQLPLSPDPSPAAAQHCLITGAGQQHFLKDHTGLRPEDVLLLQSTDGLNLAADPNHPYMTTDLYSTQFMDTRGTDLLMHFDDGSQWQRHWNPAATTATYDAWGNVTSTGQTLLHADPGTSAMVMDHDAWQQASALTLSHPSVIQSVSTPVDTSALDAGLIPTTMQSAQPAASADPGSRISSASSTSSTTSTGSVIGISSVAMKSARSSSTSSTNEKPYMKRNRKTEHPVWEFFKRTPDGNAQCSICAGVVKSPCSSNFMRHLMRHHSVEYNAVYIKWVQKRGPSATAAAAAVVGSTTPTTIIKQEY